MAPQSKLAFLKMVLPKYLSNCISILTKATFSEDGLITTHVADFRNDPCFISAYQQGKSTGSWNGVDLRWRVYTACWAARSASALPGDFVECGVNRGGMSRAIMEYIGFNNLEKRFFLLDTYCGFPEELKTVASAVNLNDFEECYNDVVATFKKFKGA